MNGSVATITPRVRFRLPLLGLGAGLLLGFMLYTQWAWFISQSWNDVRLAPAIALEQGLAIYPGPAGPPHTWMYGPLPVWTLLPAALAHTPLAALSWAGVITALISVTAIVLVGCFTPLPKADDRAWLRFTAITLTLALWPAHTLRFIQADNLAIALGLLSNLLLLRSTAPRAGWAAAALAGAGLLCKQTSVAVPLAQLVWFAWHHGWRGARDHALRLGTMTAGWWLLAAALEDPGAIGFNVFTLPGALPWAEAPWARLRDVAPDLALQLGLPLAAGLWLWRRPVDPGARLLWLTWAIALPPGVAALFTYGGNINSLQGFPLWLPAGSLLLLAALARRWRWERACSAGLVLASLVLAWSTWRSPAPDPALSRQRYDDALALARARPGEVWFPWAPLVTLYAEHHRTADEDGLAVRALAARPMARDALRPHLPARLSAIAVRRDTPLWGLAFELRPADHRVLLLGEWVIYDWSKEAAQP